MISRFMIEIEKLLLGNWTFRVEPGGVDRACSLGRRLTVTPRLREPPRTLIAKPGAAMGVWFHSGAMVQANEYTSGKPDLIERHAFSDLLPT